MIIVAGEALVDLIVRSDGRLAAEAGGGPYNTARAIARLGLPCAWAGALSGDAFGRRLEARLVADGVSLELVQRTDLPTTLALAELDEGGTATYRFYIGGTSAPALDSAVLAPAGLASRLPFRIEAAHLGTLGLVLEPMATTLEALAAALPDDAILMVDPNCRPSITPDPVAYRARVARVLARADIVKVSAEDLAFLRPGEDPATGVAWIASLGPRAVLLTDGARSVTALVAGTAHAVAVPAARVVDTVGAGDVLGGAVLACLVQDGCTRADIADPAPVLRATRFGVRAAGITCEHAGADPPTLADLGGWPAAG